MTGLGKPFRICEALFSYALLLVPLQQRLTAQDSQVVSPPPAMLAAEGLARLDVVVTDKTGKPATGLAPGDFALLDNGQPAKIVSWQAFNPLSAKPYPSVQVVLVIDEADGESPQLSAAIRDVEKYLRRNDGHLEVPVSIVRLSKGEIWETPAPLTDGNALAQVIAHPNARLSYFSKIADKGAAGKNGLPFALNALGSIAIQRRQVPGKKLMFWVGPGWDVVTKSVRSNYGAFDWITEFSTRLREARIALYCATDWLSPNLNFNYHDFSKGITSAGSALYTNLALEVLATQSGGGLLQGSNDPAELIAGRIEAERASYTLTIAVPRTDHVDEYHDVRVELDKPDLTAHTSTGYYDEPVFYDQPPRNEDVTVAQLEQMLLSSKETGDRQLAMRLSGAELTEQLSSARLHSWIARMPGPRSRDALEALADLSAFLDPPPADGLTRPPPDPAAQKQMISLAVDYLKKTIPRLPDFFAMRTTVLYHQSPAKSGATWKTASGEGSLHVAETTKTSILLRKGKEVVEREASRRTETLKTEGAFGPILAIALRSAASPDSFMKWSRWEQGANGPVATFQYALPNGEARFEAGFCCLADGDGETPFNRIPAVHGELSIDPANGAILRLTMVADLEPRLPLDQSTIMVEYSPLAIGGFTSVCPVRSVSISRARTVKVIDEWGETFRIYGPFETILNDMAFEKYHLFHSNVKILPGFMPTDSP
ncbi:MAG: VWA domain-containing protein [Terracidiphilus sp.]